MMRNLIVVGCAGLLAIGLSLMGYAGAPADTDGDGVPDDQDNCVNVSNGPLTSCTPPCCNSQEDGDLDGYGNPCDFDVDGNGIVGINDAVRFYQFAVSSPIGTDPVLDANCNGGTDMNDVIAVFDCFGGFCTPGPSGLACASLCGVPGFGCTAAGFPCP
jgi:hypothetical protein